MYRMPARGDHMAGGLSHESIVLLLLLCGMSEADEAR